MELTLDKNSIDSYLDMVVEDSIKFEFKKETGRFGSMGQEKEFTMFYFDGTEKGEVICRIDIKRPTLDYYNGAMNDGENINKVPILVSGSCHGDHAFHRYIPGFTRTN